VQSAEYMPDKMAGRKFAAKHLLKRSIEFF